MIITTLEEMGVWSEGGGRVMGVRSVCLHQVYYEQLDVPSLGLTFDSLQVVRPSHHPTDWGMDGVRPVRGREMWWSKSRCF